MYITSSEILEEFGVFKCYMDMIETILSFTQEPYMTSTEVVMNSNSFVLFHFFKKKRHLITQLNSSE